MKTDDLIEMLSSDVEPVDPRQMARNFLLVVSAALVIVVAGSALTLGLDWTGRFDNVGYLTLKVVFSLSVLGLATYFLIKHLRPGGERRAVTWPTAVPFVAAAIFASIELALSPVARWYSLMMGNHSFECVVFILLGALVPSAVIIGAVRMAAPTDPVKTGALIGVVAGATGAMAYALHCTDDSFSFIAVWYAGAIGLAGLAGSLLGPSLLRW